MKNNGCIDAGLSGCPCSLASARKCLICSKVNGGSCNDCNWQGICIYTLLQQNGGRVLISPRKERKFIIDTIKIYSENFKVFIIKADRGFCQKAQSAGAFLMARKGDCDSWYDMPISVLKSEPSKGLIHLAVCGCGPKSMSLLTADDSLIIRGIFFNGLTGIGTLTVSPEATIVYAKGIAMAPMRNFLDSALRYGRWLSNLQVYLDTSKIGFDFVLDYFGDLPIESIHISDFASETFDAISGSQGKINIFALASSYYSDIIEAAWHRDVVKPNHANMCCGEGTCGACTFDDAGGNTVHRCKART